MSDCRIFRGLSDIDFKTSYKSNLWFSRQIYSHCVKWRHWWYPTGSVSEKSRIFADNG